MDYGCSLSVGEEKTTGNRDGQMKLGAEGWGGGREGAGLGAGVRVEVKMLDEYRERKE